MRKLTAVLGLELAALSAAVTQAIIGVRTDEAKYLLSIPYPHPPLLRGIMGLTDGWPGQELLWRAVFASLLIQAVWLVWDLGATLPLHVRRAMAAAWLLSAPVLLQAGTVMLVVPTALSALLLLWLIERPAFFRSWGAIGLLWLMTIFTAYQGVLLAPLAWMVLRKRDVDPMRSLAVLGVPLALLALYSLTNPLALASMAGLGGDAAHADWFQKLGGLAWVWVLGGSAAVSALGTWGLCLRRDWSSIASFLLIMAYILASHGHGYYALLLLPFFIVGLRTIVERKCIPEAGVLPAVLGASLLVAALLIRPQPQSMAQHAAGLLPHVNQLMIVGPFGHEWQYEIDADVRHFRAGRLPVADAVVCTEACPAMQTWSEDWTRTTDKPVEIWVRRQTL